MTCDGIFVCVFGAGFVGELRLDALVWKMLIRYNHKEYTTSRCCCKLNFGERPQNNRNSRTSGTTISLSRCLLVMRLESNKWPVWWWWRPLTGFCALCCTVNTQTEARRRYGGRVSNFGWQHCRRWTDYRRNRHNHGTGIATRVRCS